MNRKDISKRIAVVVSSAMIVTSLMTGYAYGQGLGEVIYKAQTNLTGDVTYDEQIAVSESQAVEHTYVTEVKNINGGVAPYVFVGDVTGRCTLSYAKGLIQQEGYTVIAGVNGDFYDTATGVPIGMSLHDGKIKTSGANYSNTLGFNADGSAFVVPVIFDDSFTVNGNATYKFNHINKPKGISNGLHFYNSQYGKTTKTTVDSAEIVLTATDSSEPVINGTINAVVTSVSAKTKNTPIGENEIVLSAGVETANADILSSLKLGDNVSFTVTDQTGMWGNAKEAIGAYEIIAKNGAVTTNDKVTNPRTCIGIKPDGSILLYIVDGRRPGHSIGMNLADVAAYLIERGCITVVNMDGGGSTTMLARMPGDAEALLRNLPSDGKERSVSNALFLVTRNAGSGIPVNLHVYPLATFMMPGAQVQLMTKASDETYSPAQLTEPVEYSVDEGFGSVNEDGVFTAGEISGDGVVTARSGALEAQASIKITDDISINPNQTNIIIDPGNATDIGVRASYQYTTVLSTDNLFTWSCDPQIGTIDQNGYFIASNNSGVTGNITITYKGKQKVIPVQVGEEKISFKDTKGHWAQNYIETLAAKGIVKGMGEDLFLPESKLTRAQFLTMMSNTLTGLDLTTAPSANFSDVKDTDWYAPYVNWGYANKIVSGNDDGTFKPDEPITREQMAIILNNFASYAGITYAEGNGTGAFADESSISPWAINSVSIIVNAGIMNGRPDGSFDPQGLATRAEATKVIYGVVNLMTN